MKLPVCMLAGALTAALAGCADNPRQDPEFGNSVRAMVEAQTFDPEAARNPPEAAPAAGDGQRLENVVGGYRKDVARGVEDVRRDIVINVGE
jgi:type IV pilus biogenesis protein CpaD/CtpE